MALVRAQYKAAIAEALTDFIAENMTSVSVVKFDPFWERPGNITRLDESLPAICIRYANGTATDADNPDGHGWTTFWSIVYMDRIDQTDEFKFEAALDELEALFEQNDFQFPGELSADGLLIEYCRPESDSTFDDLIEHGIGGVFLSLAIAYEVYPRPE